MLLGAEISLGIHFHHFELVEDLGHHHTEYLNFAASTVEVLNLKPL